MSVITCPWCGYEDTNTAEYEFDRSGYCETQCEDCEKPITVLEHITYDYATEKRDE